MTCSPVHQQVGDTNHVEHLFHVWYRYVSVSMFLKGTCAHERRFLSHF